MVVILGHRAGINAFKRVTYTAITPASNDQVAATESFTGTTGAAWPSQWTISTAAGTAGAATIQANKGRIAPAGASGSITKALLSGMTAATDINFTGTFTSTSTNAQMAIAICDNNTIFNGNSYNSGQGYNLTFNGVTWIVNRTITATGITNIGQWSFGITAGSTYGVRLQRIGNLVRAKVWLVSSGEPTSWNVSVFETTAMPPAGQVSVSVGSPGSAYTVDWDDILVTTSTIVSQNWDYGTGAADGVAVAAGTTNGPGQVAITSTAKNAPAQMYHSSVWSHSGTLSAQMNYTSTAALYAVMPWAAGLGAQSGVREYFSFPAASTSIAKRLYEYRDTAGALLSSVNIGSNNYLNITNQAGGTIWTSANPVPHDGSSLRIEVLLTVATSSTGAYRIMMFNNDSLIPIEDSGAVTGQNFGTVAIGTVRLGQSGGASAAFIYYRDDAAWSTSANGPIGPLVIPISTVQANTAGLNSSTPTITLPKVMPGHALVLTLASFNSNVGYPIMSLSDSAGGSWVKASSTGSIYAGDIDIWYCAKHPGSAGTLTVSMTLSSAADVGIVLAEFNQPLGAVRAAALNNSASTSVASQATPALATVVGDLVIGCQGRYDNNVASGNNPGGLATKLGSAGFTAVSNMTGWVPASTTSTAMTFGSTGSTQMATQGVAFGLAA